MGLEGEGPGPRTAYPECCHPPPLRGLVALSPARGCPPSPELAAVTSRGPPLLCCPGRGHLEPWVTSGSPDSPGQQLPGTSRTGRGLGYCSRRGARLGFPGWLEGLLPYSAHGLLSQTSRPQRRIHLPTLQMRPQGQEREQVQLWAMAWRPSARPRSQRWPGGLGVLVTALWRPRGGQGSFPCVLHGACP